MLTKEERMEVVRTMYGAMTILDRSIAEGSVGPRVYRLSVERIDEGRRRISDLVHKADAVDNYGDLDLCATATRLLGLAEMYLYAARTVKMYGGTL